MDGKGTEGDSIAVIGISCRLPGGIQDPDELWRALTSGRNLVGTVPADRYDADIFYDPDPKRPGKVYTRAGGFLSNIADFDAAYFGITPREASQIDPQQRLVLEMAVEAIDDAGLDPATLAGSDTAVFVGVSAADYGDLQHANPDTINAYTNTGGALSIIANRVSYVFDLHGPSMALDTACSSGLVALHQACQSLRGGESQMAIAAGINVILNPAPTIGFAKASMLSPQGRCASFAEGGDGYVRAEGGGVLLLKPLGAALADGDRIHAVIRGSGTNADGRTAGLSLPNGAAQETLLRRVYQRAGVEVDDLVYFEAHGTGTTVGDPIECGAIGRALGQGRRAGNPLPIGSIKASSGHLEPASGIAGILKAILILRHGAIPATGSGAPLNSAIDFAGLNLQPVIETLSFSRTAQAAIGVNSFGFGGANAHVILTAPPTDPVNETHPADGPYAAVLSARSDTALGAALGHFAEIAKKAGTDHNLYDLCYTASVRRGRHPHRVAVVGRDRTEFVKRLQSAAEGTAQPGLPPTLAR